MTIKNDTAFMFFVAVAGVTVGLMVSRVRKHDSKCSKNAHKLEANVQISFKQIHRDLITQ